MENRKYRWKDMEKAKHWRGHLDQWQKSGLSQRGYCLEHDLKCHSFHYWRKKLSETASSQLRLVPLSGRTQAANPIPERALEGRRLRVLVNNLTLEVDEAIEPKVLKGVVRALVEASCGV